MSTPTIELPIQVAVYVLGAAISAVGAAATTVVGVFRHVATISPDELAIQPLHVVLIAFIIALAAFIVLILRAVWGRGIDTVNRFSEAQELLTARLKELCDLHTKRVEKLEEISLAALRDAAQGK